MKCECGTWVVEDYSDKCPCCGMILKIPKDKK